MMTDTEIRLKGIQALTDQLWAVETERFVALIQREPFDYTKWRQGLEEDLSIEEISKKAMALRKKTERFNNLTAGSSSALRGKVVGAAG